MDLDLLGVFVGRFRSVDPQDVCNAAGNKQLNITARVGKVVVVCYQHGQGDVFLLLNKEKLYIKEKNISTCQHGQGDTFLLKQSEIIFSISQHGQCK